MRKQQYLPLAVEYTQELLLVFGKDGDVLEANQSAEKELGYEKGELCRKEILSIFPAIAECTKEKNMAFFTKEELLNTNAYRKNKTCFAVDLRMVILDRANWIFLVTAVNVAKRDSAIRRLERAEEESDQIVRIRNEFVSNITHELRTPLNGILGHVRNLLGETDPVIQKESLELIEHCCEDINQIMNNILNFSKLESGNYILQEKEFSLQKMIEQVMALHMEAINKKGLQLKFMIDDAVPKKVIGDEQKLIQVLNNLLSNAIKFTLEGKIVVEVIQTLQVKDCVELFFVVLDSGIGIKEEDRDKIFQSFSQADGSTTRKYGGTGLGLAVCKELVELMQGSIHVESEEGRGSTFSFSVLLRLPRRKRIEESRTEIQVQSIKNNAMSFVKEAEEDRIYQYGTLENQSELRKELDKMLLCMDMENWEKAEQIADSIKKLVQGGEEEIRRAAFRMEMAARKADKEKAMAAYERIENDFITEKGE